MNLLEVRSNEPFIRDFCTRWKISKMSLFGSVAKNQSVPTSDLDFLIHFNQDAKWGLWDHQKMEDELASVFGCSIDLVTYDSVERSKNYLRKRSILESAVIIYESR